MRTRIAVSALVFATLAALAFALSQAPLTIRARFASVEDLAAGAPVRAHGAVVGKLATVQLAPDGSVLAEIELQRDAADHIPADSVAILAPGGIDLLLGDSSEPVGPDTTLPGYRTLTEFRLDSARHSVDKLLDELQENAEKLGKILQEHGEEAGEFLRRELEGLQKELEKTLPDGEGETGEPRSI